MIGSLLGNRYKILEKVGGGGMAVVYKAKCLLLNRNVAVKVLRPEFLQDEELVRRFKFEAQSAASLSHPNIVPIYDVGIEADNLYIVMEFIGGITLKEYIRENGVIDWEESVRIAAQICSAMEHAHKNKIIHRDIKPQNILLTNDRIVKVTDFGIARAATASTITMAGNTIGSVHYFSPEQARGGYTDVKSDLYSLGIVLYEMVTGKLPFEADTPVAVAMMQLQTRPQEPAHLNNDVPASLNNLIMKSIRKDPANRYQSASDMLSDLDQVLAEPDSLFIKRVAEDDDLPTKKMPLVVSDGSDDNEADTMIEAEEEGEDEMSDDGNEGKRSSLGVWIAVAASLLIIAAFAYIGYRFVIPSINDDSNKFVVDNYVGQDIESVRQLLTEKKIFIEEERVYDEETLEGIIISQNVAPGQELKLDGFNVIEFKVSDGREMLTVPDIVNKEARLAEIDLKEEGFAVKLEDEFSETVPKGSVIRTFPTHDMEVRPGSEITVFRSLGPQVDQVGVPDLTGKTMSEALKLLEKAGLTVGAVYPKDSSSDVAKVKKQEPLPNTTVDKGTAVDIYFEDVAGGTKSLSLILLDPDKYGDNIKVYIEVIPSNTLKPEILMNIPSVPKSSFPLPFDVQIPANGSTKVRVFLDNKFYDEKVVTVSD